MKHLLELYCEIDDFWMAYAAWQQSQSLPTDKRVKQPRLSQSEIMTIVIHFHHARYRDFKTYYTQYVRVHLKGEFPNLVSYNRFVELMERVLLPLCVYLNQCRGKCTGISFVDTTSLKVGHNKRITRHKVFAGLAKRGKTTMGWFYGFKLHLVVNDQGGLLGFKLTPGNFLVNLVSGLIAYTHQPNKPALDLTDVQLALLPVSL